MRVTSSGMQVTTFSLATNRQWQGKDGATQEETDWHTIVAWDRLAQVCAEHLSKGRLVYIEGRIQYRSWESNGQKMYKTEVVASDMLILDSKGTAPAVAESEPQAEVATSRAAARTTPRRAEPRGRAAVLDDTEDVEDLPF
jgi:single-strand DNA-binding protein